jgi:hypothetical protein
MEYVRLDGVEARCLPFQEGFDRARQGGTLVVPGVAAVADELAERLEELELGLGASVGILCPGPADPDAERARQGVELEAGSRQPVPAARVGIMLGAG